MKTIRLGQLLVRRLLLWLGVWAALCIGIVFAMGRLDVATEYQSANTLVEELHTALKQNAPMNNLALQRFREQLAENKAQQERGETKRELLTIALMLVLMALGSGVVVWLTLRPSLNRPLNQLVTWLQQEEQQHQDGPRKPASAPPGFALEELNHIAQSVQQLLITLEQEQNKSRELLRHVMELQERERQTIAQDLHDYFGQSLTSISVNSAFLVKNTSSHTQEAARAVHEQATQMMTWLRSSLRELKPHLLLEVSLRDAALDLLDTWAKRHGWFVDFAWDSKPIDITSEARIALYRSLQEALTNVARHAKAKRVKVLAGFDPQAMQFILIVENDGLQTSAPVTPSLGLNGIRERLVALGGLVDWQLDSPVFRLNCRVPATPDTEEPSHHAH
ncbi:sensor histidine kinase [Limnobacter sp.]|uniref:sensor histidine kinase n=1 Tax=Limnobacter sp. TaxID=2003368 RepID=UPI0035136BA4